MLSFNHKERKYFMIETIFAVLVLIFSVVAHEVSHGYMALRLGDPTARLAGRLTMNPLRHIDPIGSVILPLLTIPTGYAFGWAKPVPYNPYNLSDQKWGDTKVALAGPFTNIGIALIFGLMIRYGVNTFSQEVLHLLTVIVGTNIVLAVFNLMPIPPLDGSKLLLNLLPYRYRYIGEYMERYSLVFLLIFIFFLWQMFQPVIGYLFGLITGTL